MKTPISYYGGKQRLVPEILPLIPKHTQYVEPFCGGAAVFWAKNPSAHEVINDIDGRVVNFYRVLQTRFPELQQMIRGTLHSEADHRRAKTIMDLEEADSVERAWAFWVQTAQSFSNKLYSGFGHGHNRSDGGKFTNTVNSKRLQIAADNGLYTSRLEGVEVFSRDAIGLIKAKDRADVFMYLDPPYKGSNCGHYTDKVEVFDRLLEILPTLQCKWLMSSYPDERLDELRKQHGWHTQDIDANLSVSGKHNAGKRKTECLTWNYSLAEEPIGLFAKEHLAA
ncbi:DNA adenine methylase [Hymenobacter busanensis]|uniref:DNA adenine methylase n=1 Tax=Hymenobacter busanensis TaxID=2607656 RepID=A0A7L4ZYM5_9BACT|nr:DNA adenine methylase [Hymenobacter busanensis]KAA9333375.1 DNA adenine methylase [Hymenobacter busanensis]QHJ07946.1 DNA adenine methylase [Hymenobacter busanensis]